MTEQHPNAPNPNEPPAEEARFVEGAVRHEFTDNRLMNYGRLALAKLRGDTIYAPFDVTDPETGEESQIDLITPKHLDELPDGTALTSINGKKVVKGEDNIDGDTRGGMLAFGLPTQTSKQNMYTGPHRSK